MIHLKRLLLILLAVVLIGGIIWGVLGIGHNLTDLVAVIRIWGE